MFDSILDPWKERWQSLSRRDRQAALLLAVSVTVSIVIFGIVMPIHTTSQTLERELAAATNTYDELVSLAPKAMGNQTAAGGELNVNSINSEVRRQAARYGVEVQRFEPDQDRLKVWLEDARYPSVIQWLGGLETIGITHVELTLDDRPNPGLVNVRVTFAVGE